ncbi:MAG: hypothetical protein WBK77_01160 [Alphaproteobacteria bacterium]
MKLIFLSALLLLLAACSATNTSKPALTMPKEFLGYWLPLSRGLANIGTTVHNDGRIEHIHDDNKKLYQNMEYRVIHIAGARDVYLAMHEFPNEHSSDHFYQYVHLTIKNPFYAPDETYLKWEDFFLIEPKEWSTMTDQQLWKNYTDNMTSSNNPYPSGDSHYIRE